MQSVTHSTFCSMQRGMLQNVPPLCGPITVNKLGKPALSVPKLRRGEATGAALAVEILKAAVAGHTGMATFEEAAVNGGKSPEAP